MTEDGRTVLIIGAGLAGLACARELNARGVACTILEASDRIGGRLGSDRFDGFILDRGFQVFLEGYPEAQRVLDYAALDLKRFDPGAIVHWNGKQYPLVDPRRRRAAALRTALSPLATWRDKLSVLRLIRDTAAGPRAPHESTQKRLESYFSPVVIERFFRPFFGGVFLDSSLSTSSRMFDLTFRFFATSDTALPANGMQAIADQLVGRLTDTTILLNATVVAIEGSMVRLTEGQRFGGRAVVLATDAGAASHIASWADVPRARRWASTTCVYFSAPQSPLQSKLLVLNGDGPYDGPINHLCVPSDIAPAYAPPGKALICCSAIGFDHAGIESRAIDQLRNWFGPQVDDWEHLRTYRIPHALPDQSVSAYEPVERPARVGQRLYICGDHCDFASINGALRSGRRAAEALLAVEKLA